MVLGQGMFVCHRDCSFVLNCLLLDPDCCLRAHTVLIKPVEAVEPGGGEIVCQKCIRSQLLAPVSGLPPNNFRMWYTFGKGLTAEHS